MQGLMWRQRLQAQLGGPTDASKEEAAVWWPQGCCLQATSAALVSPAGHVRCSACGWRCRQGPHAQQCQSPDRPKVPGCGPVGGQAPTSLPLYFCQARRKLFRHCRVKQFQQHWTWTRRCLRLAACSNLSQLALTANQQGHQEPQPCLTGQMSACRRAAGPLHRALRQR